MSLTMSLRARPHEAATDRGIAGLFQLSSLILLPQNPVGITSSICLQSRHLFFALPKKSAVVANNDRKRLVPPPPPLLLLLRHSLAAHQQGGCDIKL